MTLKLSDRFYMLGTKIRGDIIKDPEKGEYKIIRVWPGKSHLTTSLRIKYNNPYSIQEQITISLKNHSEDEFLRREE
jgi:hypothetical protein